MQINRFGLVFVDTFIIVWIVFAKSNAIKKRITWKQEKQKSLQKHAKQFYILCHKQVNEKQMLNSIDWLMKWWDGSMVKCNNENVDTQKKRK